MRKKYKGGVLDNTRDKISESRDLLSSNSWYMQIVEVFFYFWIFFIVIDIIAILPYNIIYNSGPGGCIKAEWFTVGIFTLPSWLFNFRGTKCSEVDPDIPKVDDGKCSGGLGIWEQYDSTDPKKGFLCPSEITKVFNDAISDNIAGGYSGYEILAYIIIPTLTVVGIIYGLIFTRLNYSEWIFWILITTLIYTGVSSIAKSTDIELLPPDQPSPLRYITEKLDFQNTDELQYNIMARKSDGSSCLVEGVFLGGGIHTSEGEPTYTGDSVNCSSEGLSLT